LKSTGFVSVRLFAVLAWLVVATMTARNALWYAYWGVNYMTFAFAPAVAVFYAFASGRVVVVSRGLGLFGTASYSTYLTHIYVPHALPLAALPWLVRVGVWTVVALVVSVPLYFYVELPFIKAGRALPKGGALREGSASGGVGGGRGIGCPARYGLRVRAFRAHPARMSESA
jgi:peptidoglycan/LPS O-acetylase OafA/YrhL